MREKRSSVARVTVKKIHSIKSLLMHKSSRRQQSAVGGRDDHIMMVLFNYEYYKALKKPSTQLTWLVVNLNKFF